MQLKLLFEQTGQSWTLKPNRDYIIGSGQDADISLPFADVVADRHFKLSFDQTFAMWYVDDLGSAYGTSIDGAPITRQPIQDKARITIGHLALVVQPAVTAAAVPTPPPPTISAPPVYQSPPSPTPALATPTPTFAQTLSPKTTPPPYKGAGGKLSLLTWPQFVEQQVHRYAGLKRLAVNFYMVTGLRNTPWIRKAPSIEPKSANGFDAFDGYILPDITEPAEKIAVGIEEKLARLTQYEGTDCFVTWLTDAHIVDTGTRHFEGVELFPIYRGGKADFRRFCVVSYHRVRTYLLVENYGTDLFVSWITRFEPEPTSGFMILWLLLASILTLGFLPFQNLFVLITPLSIWSAIYLLVPAVMKAQGILPKKANARLIMALVLIPWITILIAGAANSGFPSRFSGSPF